MAPVALTTSAITTMLVSRMIFAPRPAMSANPPVNNGPRPKAKISDAIKAHANRGHAFILLCTDMLRRFPRFPSTNDRAMARIPAFCRYSMGNDDNSRRIVLNCIKLADGVHYGRPCLQMCCLISSSLCDLHLIYKRAHDHWHHPNSVDRIYDRVSQRPDHKACDNIAL